MSKTDLKNILEEASAGKFRPVYFLHGDETFLTRQAVDALVERVVDKATADFNFERFQGADLNLERLLTALETPPMLAARRVVLVRDLEKTGLRVREMLADYAGKPSSSTVLILAAGERIKVDARQKSPKWAARLEEAAATVIFWPLREADLIRWLVSRAALKGKSLKAQTAQELYARSGDDLGRLSDEIEKLSIYCGARPEIESRDVVELTGIEKGGTVFDWVESLAAGRTLQACYIAGYLSARGESAVGAIAAAASHFTRLAWIKDRLDSGQPGGEIRKSLGLAHWRDDSVNALFGQARNYSREKIVKALALLLEADLKLKTSSLPDSLVLDELAFLFKSEAAG